MRKIAFFYMKGRFVEVLYVTRCFNYSCIFPFFDTQVLCQNPRGGAVVSCKCFSSSLGLLCNNDVVFNRRKAEGGERQKKAKKAKKTSRLAKADKIGRNKMKKGK